MDPQKGGERSSPGGGPQRQVLRPVVEIEPGQSAWMGAPRALLDGFSADALRGATDSGISRQVDEAASAFGNTSLLARVATVSDLATPSEPAQKEERTYRIRNPLEDAGLPRLNRLVGVEGQRRGAPGFLRVALYL